MTVNRILNGLERNLDANKLFNVNISDFDNLASDEIFVARQMHNWMGVMFENNFAQYQMDLLTDDYWKQQGGRKNKKMVGEMQRAAYKSASPELSGVSKFFARRMRKVIHEEK